MLFSSDPVATYINAKFEPVWESVRPVPVVTIDFGNGERITRTLHGNISTSVCDPTGRVLDVLPGLYSPGEYRRQLEQFALLHQYLAFNFGMPPFAERFVKYHRTQAELLAKAQPPAQLVFNRFAGVSKARVENPVKLVIGAKPEAIPTPKTDRTPVIGWDELAADTRVNETARRKQIHEQLAATGTVKPDRLVKWLYREVLHADLDDPTLGIGRLLDDTNPFAAEDRAAHRK